jgi:tripartite-type tricarboxylate transporter receptor subunit TctC
MSMSKLDSAGRAAHSLTPSRRSVIAGLAVLPVMGSGASAQGAFPDRPLKIIVAYGTGTGTDATARRLANELQGVLGQPVIVENRPGGNAFIGTEAAARSAPDGHTMIMATDHIMCFNPALFSKLPYDPKKDFAAVAGVITAPYLLAVNADLPAKTLAELIALAKSKPEKLTFASTGVGTSSQLVGELFQAEAGIKLTHVPYQGGAQLFSDLLSGTVSMCFYPYQQFQPHLQSGRIRALGVTTQKRQTFLPDVPTFAELGFPKMDMAAFLSIFVPAGTPKDRINKLSEAIKTVLAKPSVADPLAAAGFPTSYMTPDDLMSYTLKEMDRCKAIVNLAGVKVE